MAIANLNNTPEEVLTGKDNIVIVDNFQSIRGGRTLDVEDFTPDVINAGHVIIKDESTGEYKPMPLVSDGAIDGLGAITGGSNYVDATYTKVPLTGGSGSGAEATVSVEDGAVKKVIITKAGSGYVVSDELSASNAKLGGAGSGFKVVVAGIPANKTVYGSLPAAHSYAGILIASISKKKPFAGIMVRGTVNHAAAPYPMTSILAAVKAALPLIIFRED